MGGLEVRGKPDFTPESVTGGRPTACRECGSADAIQIVATALGKGRAFTFRVTPGTEGALPATYGCCKRCYWSAIYEMHRRGVDAHTHPPWLEPCPPRCLTRLGGRRTQIEIFEAHIQDPNEGHRVTKWYDGIKERGSLPINGLRTTTFFGLGTRQFFYEPLHSFESLEDVLLFNRELDAAHVPLSAQFHPSLSFRCFQSAWTAPGGRLPLPNDTDREIERHAVAIVEMDDTGGIIFRNSWGYGWGDRGHGYMSREYFDRYWVEGWVARNCSWGLSRFTYDRIMAATTGTELFAAWMLPNPIWRKRQRTTFSRLILLNFETISVNESCAVDVLEVRNGYGLRLAWLYMSHPPPDGNVVTSEIRELFVWPTFRRMGIGSLLERHAAWLARLKRSDRLRIHLHEADGHVAVRRAGRLFGQTRGYRWVWRAQNHPALVAIGERDLPS